MRFWWAPCSAAFAIGVHLLLLQTVKDHQTLRVINDVFWSLSCTAAVLASAYVARRSSGRLRTFWLILTAAAAVWLVAQLIWDWFELSSGGPPSFPSVSDVMFTGFPILSVIAFMFLRDPHGTPHLLAARLGNLALTVWALVIIFVLVLFEAVASSGRSVTFAAFAFSGALIVAGGFVISLYFLWSYRWGGAATALTLVVAAAAVHSGATLAYMRHLLLDEYRPDQSVNLAWGAAFLLQLCAAAEQMHSLRVRAHSAQQLDVPRNQWVEAIVPGLLLLVIGGTALATRAHLSARVVGIAGPLFMLFGLGVGLRDLWIHYHEVRLRRQLSDTNRQLSLAKAQIEATLDDLRIVEERFRLAVEGGNVGVWDYDLRQHKAYYSPQWRKQLGFQADEIEPTLAEWRSRVHPDDIAHVDTMFSSSASAETPELRFEHRMRARDGSYRWMLTQASVVLDHQQQPVRLLGSQVDITSQKLAENALRESEARLLDLTRELEHRVVERTAQLQDAYSELESFAYAVSHDLKAPLRAIDGFSHLLLEQYDQQLDAQGKSLLGRVRRGAAQMASLIDGLLAYSRTERRELHEDAIDIAQLVQSALDEHAEQIRERKVIVHCTVPPAIVHADREGVALVLRNLLGNAIKFTRDVPDPTIEIGCEVRPRTLTVTVKDNGIGFEQQYHDQIFKIFQRLHRIDEYPGTGIGLALARKAVQRMGGRIWAESEPGKGAKFFVELPMIAGQERSRTPSVAAAAG
jgi:PAS domain S-box-containing protein